MSAESAVSYSFIERAIEGVRRRIPVIPLLPRSKKTHIGARAATLESSVITQWNLDNPDYNCGFVAQAKPGGVWILDCDSPEVAKEFDQATGQPFPRTFAVQSSSGGHRYFRQDQASLARLRNFSVSRNGKEFFSVRWDNEYCVGPLSIHEDTGQIYKIVSDVDPIEAPDFVIDWLLAQAPEQSGFTVSDERDEHGLIPHGSIHNHLVVQAGKLRQQGFPVEAIEAALVAWAYENCAPPIDEAKVIQVARSSGNWEQGDPSKPDVTLSGKVPGIDSPAIRHDASAEVKTASDSVGLQAYSQIKNKKLIWLWPGRIPLGKLTLAVGNPDQGKSLFVIDLASLISTGNNFPDGTENLLPPSSVILCEAEDDSSDTIGPRLQAAGADVSRVFRMHSIVAAEKDSQGAVYLKERMVQFDTDLQRIENTIRQNADIKLLIVSPLSGYIGEANLIDDKAVRKALTPLQEMAGRLNIAIVAVMHLNKSAEFDVIYRISGAMGFVAVARATWLFCSDKVDPEKHFMLHVKGNLAKKADGLVYRIKTKGVQVEDETIEQPYISWEGTTMEDANEVMRASCGLGTKRNSDEAKYWLLDVMRQHNWSIGRVELVQLIERSGIPANAIDKAKRLFGIIYRSKDQAFVMEPIADNPDTQVPW